MRKLLAFIISITLAVAIAPTQDVSAAAKITSTKELKGSDYTSSKKLASKLDDVFKGKIGLYSGGTHVHAPVGSSKVHAYRMYQIKDSTNGGVTSGWQCYIYANAVYNTLFNEDIGHGESLSHSRKVISNGGSSLSYKQLKKAGVRTGAYVRVASNYSGCYNNGGGHSLIILSYDKNGIAYIEGNSDNQGLISVTESSWSEFNRSVLTRLSRKVCYIIQPTKDYYNSLYHTPEKVKLSKLKKKEKTKVKLKWNKVSNVKGYQIKYAKDKKFTDDTSVKNAKSSAKSKIISKLDGGETYYFKVRAYNKIDNKKVYGKWSNVRKTQIAEDTQKKPDTSTPIITAPEETTSTISSPNETTNPDVSSSEEITTVVPIIEETKGCSAK